MLSVQRALRANPNYVEAHRLRATLCADAGDYDGAVAILEGLIKRGNDWPEDLSGYDLIVHCGECMSTRRHVLGRIAQAKAAGVAICNYGVVLAKLAGILDKVCTTA